MSRIRYWVLSQVIVFMTAYLIDSGRKDEALRLGEFADAIMPKIKTGQVKLAFHD